MTYNFDEIIDRHNTWSSKWDHGQDGEKQSSNCIPMWVADMDFACPPPVIESIKKKADDRIFGYFGIPDEYWNAVISFYERRHGFKADKSEIIYTRGVVGALSYAVKALTEPGDEIIIQPPVYPPFFSAVNANDRVVSENRLILHDDGSYSIDWDDLEKKASSKKAKALLLCSPHNPTGILWSEADLRRMQEICLKHNLIFLCDEIHNDLIRNGEKHVSLKALYPNADNIVVCTAPSKTFNLAGLAVSHMFCPNEEYREKIKKVVGRVSPDPFTVAAVISAYTECDDWIDQLNTYIDKNFLLFYELCKKHFPKAVPTQIHGTYLAWLDVREYVGDNTAELESRLYKECGVYIEAGNDFSGKGFLRINLACPAKYIEDAFIRVSSLCNDKNGSINMGIEKVVVPDALKAKGTDEGKALQLEGIDIDQQVINSTGRMTPAYLAMLEKKRQEAEGSENKDKETLSDETYRQIKQQEDIIKANRYALFGKKKAARKAAESKLAELKDALERL